MKKIVFLTLTIGIATSAWADKACYEVQGMTCATCGVTVKAAIKKLKGIQLAKASVEKNNAIVEFDPAQTSVDAIKNAIDDAGYKAIPRECKSIGG